MPSGSSIEKIVEQSERFPYPIGVWITAGDRYLWVLCPECETMMDSRFEEAWCQSEGCDYRCVSGTNDYVIGVGVLIFEKSSQDPILQRWLRWWTGSDEDTEIEVDITEWDG